MRELIYPVTPSLSTNAGKAARLAMPTIKVIGLGGGGSNAVNRMIELGLSGVEFVAANTDRQALSSSLAPTRIQLGPRLTRGLGAGGDPRTGAAAAMESSREIAAALSGADMVFVTAGLGGGTGTGAAPVTAEIAREGGALVVSIVTMPFSFEMTRRAKNALEGLRGLQPHSHTLISVPNDRLLQIVPADVSLEVAFRVADDVLRQGVQGVSELVTRPGQINVDFAHVRNLMLRGGGSLMAIGLGEGPDKAAHAIQQALNHPLVEIESLAQANGVLVHFSGGEDLSLYEVGQAISDLRSALAPEAEVVFGATTDETLAGRAQVILIVTGIGGRPVPSALMDAEQEPRQAHGGETQVARGPQAPGGAQAPSDTDLDLPTFLRRRLALG